MRCGVNKLANGKNKFRTSNPSSNFTKQKKPPQERFFYFNSTVKTVNDVLPEPVLLHVQLHPQLQLLRCCFLFRDQDSQLSQQRVLDSHVHARPHDVA